MGRKRDKRRDKKSKRRRIEGGLSCPKCNRKRFEHAAGWKPKIHQPHYFKFWDRCIPCRHVQLYETAKVLIPIPDALTKEYREVVRG
jgi:hypothetical protein